MDPQKQLESLIEKSVIYIQETDKNKQVFSEMFSGNENNDNDIASRRQQSHNRTIKQRKNTIPINKLYR